MVVYLTPRRKACIDVCTDFCGASEIGTALVAALRETAAASGSGRLRLTTANDNLHAPRFNPARGFRLAVLYPDAVKHARALKPEISEIGTDGIPIRDEIELDLSL